MPIFGFNEIDKDAGNNPSYGIRLTESEIKIIGDRKPVIFTADGRTIFDIRSPNGGSTGDKGLFIVFV